MDDGLRFISMQAQSYKNSHCNDKNNKRAQTYGSFNLQTTDNEDHMIIFAFTRRRRRNEFTKTSKHKSPHHADACRAAGEAESKPVKSLIFDELQMEVVSEFFCESLLITLISIMTHLILRQNK
eukprot:383434_1